MGIIEVYRSQWAGIEDHRRTLLSCATAHCSKSGSLELKAVRERENDRDYRDRLVCVTSGVSYLGIAIVSRLLVRGYSVRLIVTNQEDLEKVREMEVQEVHNSRMVSGVVANFGDVGNLLEAFEGCRGVFHTASLIDPSGLSGYSKSMGEIEAKTCENVMEACARSCSVRKCVLTSSLLTCIWGGDHSTNQLSSSTINHNNWSDESFCTERRLWYALGKLRAEKAAWKVAEKRGFKLVTICPGLVTGPQICHRNPTTSIAYLKGAQEMYVKGLLATVDVNILADAHICIYEAMNKNAFGRYICFDRVIQNEEEVEDLARGMGMQPSSILGNDNSLCRFELSNTKLSSLMSTTQCRDELYS